MHNAFYKIIKQHKCVQKSMRLEQQISILIFFLKDHVTLKAAENSALPSQE